MSKADISFFRTLILGVIFGFPVVWLACNEEARLRPDLLTPEERVQFRQLFNFDPLENKLSRKDQDIVVLNTIEALELEQGDTGFGPEESMKDNDFKMPPKERMQKAKELAKKVRYKIE